MTPTERVPYDDRAFVSVVTGILSKMHQASPSFAYRCMLDAKNSGFRYGGKHLRKVHDGKEEMLEVSAPSEAEVSEVLAAYAKNIRVDER